MSQKKFNYCSFTQRGEIKMILASVVILVLVLVAGYLFSSGVTAQSTQARTWELQEDVFPKESLEILRLQGLESENFLDDFGVEVKNISNKPIYYINMVVTLPDSLKLTNKKQSLRLKYGDDRLYEVSELAKNTDKAISPGESILLKISESTIKGYKAAIKENKSSEQIFSRLRLVFQSLNYGNGTGYRLSYFVDKTGKKVSATQKIQQKSMIRNFLGTTISAKPSISNMFDCPLKTGPGKCCGVDGCEIRIAVPNYDEPRVEVCNQGSWCYATACGGGVFCNDLIEMLCNGAMPDCS